jgi:hypothetical protein
MNRLISSIQVEFFYDVPLIFSASDKIGRFYICELIDQNENTLKYICLPISHRRLKDFRLGQIDLRSIFVEPEMKEFYECSIENFESKEFEISLLPSKELPETYLPDGGFYLADEKIVDVEIKKTAKAANRPVFKVILNPPESSDGPVIIAERLSHFLFAFNNLIKHAYRKTCKKIPRIKTSLSHEDGHKLRILSFSEGSFSILFETLDIGDLFGSCAPELSFQKIDELVRVAENPEKSVEILKTNKGHLANAYIKLLEFITENDTSIEYEWASPTLPKSQRGKLLQRFARPLLETLRETEGLSIELIELTGVIIKANKKSGAWTIVNDEDQKEYSGTIKPESKISLDGIIISTQKYKFFCEESLEVIPATGKERSSLQVTKIIRLDT